MNVARLAMARARSAGRVFGILAPTGAGLAAASVSLPLNNGNARDVGGAVLGGLIEDALQVVGNDATVVATSMRGHMGRITILSDKDARLEDIERKQARLIDVAPSMLALMDIATSDHMRGINLLDPIGANSPTFDLPEVSSETRSDSAILVEAVESGELDQLPEQRRLKLVRFLRKRLEDEWLEARTQLDFRKGTAVASLLVRFEQTQANLWRLAFACHQSGDRAAASDATTRLLEAHPGSPPALLSAVLTSDSASSEELLAIVTSIDPADLKLPSVRSVWGRSAIKAGMVDEGLEVLEDLIAKGNPLLLDRVVAANALRTKGDQEKALAVLGPVGRSATAPLQWRLLRARLLLQNGNVDEAKRTCESILESFPQEARATEILERCDSSEGAS